MLQAAKMAGVVEDMEEKGEMKREKVEKKEESLEKVRVEHSLEGDFQFLPSELALHNPEQVITFLGATSNGTYFLSGFIWPLD